MIQDATGKFSSRWLLPDRSSLALVIRNRLSAEKIGFSWRWAAADAAGPHAPYRGIRLQNQCYRRWRAVRPWPDRCWCRLQARFADAKCPALLAVVLQHHVASLGQLGAVLLQAGENSEVALIDHRTAVTLNIPGTGRLLLGRSATLLRDGGGGDRQGQQDQSQERFVHSVPSF